MRLSAVLAFSRALPLILGLALPAWSGSLPPCVKAASSKTGNFLVLMNMQLDPPQSNEGVTRRVQKFSFEVFPKESFINAKDRMTAPTAYWTDWRQWGVALDRNTANQAFTSACQLPLVTDDGEFLILLAEVPALSADFGVLRIYQWDHMSKEIPSNGRLIRELPLKKFYVPLDSPCCTDESPEWFAGSSFDFSSNDRELIYKSQYGNTIRISLSDGSVLSK